jgi:hypothetical protein
MRISSLLLTLVVAGCAGSSGSTADISSVRVSALAIRVQADHFVDGSGRRLQLRGVNVANSLSRGGQHLWDSSNLTVAGNASPDWSKIKAWNANAVRYILDEASWLGLVTTSPSGKTVNMDPSADYRATVLKDVAAINSLGMYVILDLHSVAPGNATPLEQNPMPDADHSLAFWRSVAQTFKGNPAVLFELFNEPYLGTTASNGVSPACFTSLPNGANYYIRNGGAQAFCFQSDDASGRRLLVNYNWITVGYQQLLEAVRAAGATNVVIMGGQGYDNDETWWTTNPPTDTLNPAQIAINYHAYPTTWGYEMTGTSKQHSAAVSQAMLTSPGVPVIITELGGPVGNQADMTWDNNMLNLIDRLEWSVMAWTWNPWGGNNTLIRDINTYIPTPGLGATYHNWLVRHQ